MSNQVAISKKPIAQGSASAPVHHWSKRKHHPWYSCCDTRSIVMIFQLLHQESQSYYVHFGKVLDFLNVFLANKLVFDGGIDTRHAFGDRSPQELCDDVVNVIIMLVAEEVLEPDKTRGDAAFYRLMLSTSEINRAHFRLAALKLKQQRQQRDEIE